MAVCPLCGGDFVSERILPVFSPKHKLEGDGRDTKFSSRLIFNPALQTNPQEMSSQQVSLLAHPLQARKTRPEISEISAF